MKRCTAIVFAILTAACATQAPPPSLDAPAANYVKLALALGEHDTDWVDAYYGPPEWREAVKAEKKSVAEIHAAASALRDEVQRVPVPRDHMLALRRNYLIEQLGALITKAEMLEGKKFMFEEEARRLYGVTPPRHDDAFFANAIAALEKELPGDGPLSERLEAFRKRFYIPDDKLDAVMRAAIKECRARTLQHIQLPANESFTMEYVKNQPWGAYNWYKGNSTSLIQVNTDLPIPIGSALGYGCHEGYPGHHVYNALLEKNLVRDRGWVEYSVYPLFSPQSLIAEGSANFGVEMAFPGDEAMKFNRDVLFPLAGLDPAEAERYHRVGKLGEAIAYTSNEAARRWLDGEMTRDEAKAWLMKYSLRTEQRAEQQMKFIERYRSYVINYNVGEDLVRQHIHDWDEFRELLSTPMLPSNLR